MRDVHRNGPLATAEPDEVRNDPVEADLAKLALDEPGRLPQRHVEQHFDRQTGLHRRVTVDGMSAWLGGRLCRPRNPGIKLDRQ